MPEMVKYAGLPRKELIGESGTKYTVHLIPLDMELEDDIGGVYVMFRRILNPMEHPTDIPIYIGKAVRFSTRFEGHHKLSCFQNNGMTHLGLMQMTNEDEMLDVESDLIRALKPVCNDQIPKKRLGLAKRPLR